MFIIISGYFSELCNYYSSEGLIIVCSLWNVCCRNVNSSKLICLTLMWRSRLAAFLWPALCSHTMNTSKQRVGDMVETCWNSSATCQPTEKNDFHYFDKRWSNFFLMQKCQIFLNSSFYLVRIGHLHFTAHHTLVLFFELFVGQNKQVDNTGCCDGQFRIVQPVNDENNHETLC